MLAEMEKVDFCGISPDGRRYLYLKPCGFLSDSNEVGFWLMSVTLQVPGKWLCCFHGSRVQRHRVLSCAAHLRDTWEVCLFTAGFSVTDSPKMSLQIAKHCWAVRSETALMQAWHRKAIWAWDSTQAILLTQPRQKENWHMKRLET